MKNNFSFFSLIFFFIFFFIFEVNANEVFNFNVSEIEITDNGKKIKGIKRGKISTNEGLIIEADSFEFDKARNNLKTNFILQEVARAENIEVNDAEVFQRVNAMAKQQKKSPKALAKEMQRSGRISSLRSSILIGKAIDFLIENAKIEEAEVEAEAAKA